MHLPTFTGPSVFTFLPTENGAHGHTSVLYSTSDNYSNGFAHVYPICTATRITSHQVGGCPHRTSPGANAHLLSGLVTQSRKCSSAATATSPEMPSNPNNEGDPNKCEYQFVLQQKVSSPIV